MEIEQTRWSPTDGWIGSEPGGLGDSAGLVLLFGSREALSSVAVLEAVRSAYPQAIVTGCSTAGEILDSSVADGSCVVTAVSFRATSIRAAQVTITDPAESYLAGQKLVHSLQGTDLTHLFVLSPGLGVNGSELVQGLQSDLPGHITVTGGLAGDGTRFQKTLVVADGQARPDIVAGIGFYGDRLNVGYGSLGGWDPFGPERLITRSEGNVLYELDGRSALDLYKRYLGEHAAELPASGLLFPLALRTGESDPAVVRTILSIDETEQSLTFAGDVPVGSYARLMKANFDRLIDGAAAAAKTSTVGLVDQSAELAILISCVGRKMVLQQRVEEEIEGVREVLGPTPAFAGFYSYGEISPFTPSARCELHNQTMTITTLVER